MRFLHCPTSSVTSQLVLCTCHARKAQAPSLLPHSLYPHTARLLSSRLSRQACHGTLTALNPNTVLMSTDGLDELLIFFGEQDGFATVH